MYKKNYIFALLSNGELAPIDTSSIILIKQYKQLGIPIHSDEGHQVYGIWKVHLKIKRTKVW